MKKKENINYTFSQPHLEQLQKLFELLNVHKIAEFKWKECDQELKIKTQYAQTQEHFSSHSIPTSTHSSQPPKTEMKEVKSDVVGIFYQAPSPEAQPYVTEGQMVQEGDTLCIIEVMKAMIEIKAKFSGKIVSILVKNGQVVESEQALFLMDPSC